MERELNGTAHLSICAGYLGGEGTLDYIHLDCSLRPGGFKFREDDKFILDYSSVGHSCPVIPPYDINSFDLRSPFAMLVLGIIFSVLSVASILYELFTLRQTRLVTIGSIYLVSVCAIGVWYSPWPSTS